MLKKTPGRIVSALNDEINAILANPKTNARLTELGGTVKREHKAHQAHRGRAALLCARSEELSESQDLGLFYIGVLCRRYFDTLYRHRHIDIGAARLTRQRMHVHRDKPRATFYDVPIGLYGKLNVH
jgi:hypothetical protein